MDRFVSGPAYIYVSKNAFGSGSASTIDGAPSAVSAVAPSGTPAKADIHYLGTCEMAPKIRVNPQWEKLMNDIGGIMVPIDYTFQGEDGEVSGTLTMWNEQVYQNIQAKPAQNLGVSSRTEIGTMWSLEGGCRHLWIVFPYANKSVYSAAGMPTCYHFYNVRPLQEDMSIGTAANKRLLALGADRFFAPSTGALGLYDNSLSASLANPGSNGLPTPLIGSNVTAHTGALI